MNMVEILRSGNLLIDFIGILVCIDGITKYVHGVVDWVIQSEDGQIVPTMYQSTPCYVTYPVHSVVWDLCLVIWVIV